MDTAAAGVIDIQNSKHVEDDLGHSEDTTTEDTVEILQDSRDYKVLDSISDPQNKTDHNSTTEFVDIDLIESEMLIVPTATDLARTVTINKTSKHNQSDNDNAELKPSQTQIPSVWDTFSLAETEADDDDDAAETTWEHTSFTTQFDNYDSYSDSYQDPSLFSLSRDESSFVLRPSYNFSGLQVTPLTVTPRAWVSHDQFIQQVGLKLYMFVPAIVAGTLLSLSFWILAMILLRTYGALRRKLFPSDTSADLEMNCSENVKEIAPSAPPILKRPSYSSASTQTRSPESRSQYCSKPAKLLGPGPALATVSPNSSPVSQVSSSSGVCSGHTGDNTEDGDGDSLEQAAR